MEKGGDPSPEDMVFDIDGEDLIFSDDAFLSLPDFPCLSSPPSPSTASNPITSTSSSSSSSPSCGLAPAAAAAAAQPFDPQAFDLLDSSLWDPAVLFPDEQLMVEDDGGVAPLQAEAAGETEDLASVFLEWLKSNRDSISPEDLRSIRLRRSTIECAARRLGGGRQGMLQLLKLILAWVQDHHLQKRRRFSRVLPPQQDPHHHQNEHHQQQFHHHNLQQHHMNPSANPNPNYLDYAGPWATVGSQAYPGTLMVPASAAGDMAVVVPTPEFDPTAAWPSHFAAAASPAAAAPQVHYPSCSSPALPLPPPPSPAAMFSGGGFGGQFNGQQLYHDGQRLARLASATKEARKKRMARQRRFSAMHHHHRHHHHNNQQQQQQQQQQQAQGQNEEGQQFWAPFSSSSSSNPIMTDGGLNQSLVVQQQNYQRHTYTSSDNNKRQAWKPEKNLRFLLQKVLKQSDVGSLGRIVLPKKEAEIHLPELDARDGISIAMEDIGTSKVWNMRYRFWPNNKSRMYLLENTGDFIRSNGLQEGDFIVIYSDVKCGKYMIRGVKVRQPPPELKVAGSKNAVKATANQRKNGMEKGNSSKSKHSSCYADHEEASTSSAGGDAATLPSMNQMDLGP